MGDQNKLDRQKLTDNVEKQDPKGLPSFFKKNEPTPTSFIVHFRSFQGNIITIFTTKNICEKCPFCKQCRGSNPRPLEHEFLSIITRPGLAGLLDDPWNRVLRKK